MSNVTRRLRRRHERRPCLHCDTCGSAIPLPSTATPDDGWELEQDDSGDIQCRFLCGCGAWHFLSVTPAGE